MNFFHVFFNLFLQSDLFSKILVFVLVLSLFFLFVFFVYGYIRLSYKINEAKEMLQKYHDNSSLNISDSPLISFLYKSKQYTIDTREELFFLMIDDFLLSENRLKVFFGVFASVGPLLGLLGTIWGIVDVFLHLEGTADLAVIAPGIAEGLITTAAGLFLAIPAFCFYHLFNYLIEKYYRLVSSLYYLFYEKEKGIKVS
jgi:biopolymer transport protein ExbB/TolQ